MTFENRSSGFPTRSDRIRSLQTKKKDRILIFLVHVNEKLYFPCCENKGADQLCLFFRIGKYLFFLVQVLICQLVHVGNKMG